MSSRLMEADATASRLDVDALMEEGFPRGDGVIDAAINWFQSSKELDTVTGAKPDMSLNNVDRNLFEKSWQLWDETSLAFEAAKKAMEAVNGVRPKRRASARDSFQAIQEWEGYVDSVGEHGFCARLIDKTANESEFSEQAEFSFNDVQASDMALLTEGALFRWAVGYEKTVSGSRRKISSLIFRRLPVWSQEEMRLSRLVADDLMSKLTWD